MLTHNKHAKSSLLKTIPIRKTKKIFYVNFNSLYSNSNIRKNK